MNGLAPQDMQQGQEANFGQVPRRQTQGALA
jgi:hypothetical protein